MESAAHAFAAPQASSGDSDVLLRGGAVQHRGRAVLLLDGSGRGGGTSHLVAALVSAGAGPIADSEVRVDERGRVRLPGAPNNHAAEIALIVATEYCQEARWDPRTLHGVRAVLPLLDRAASATGSVHRLLRLASRVARNSVLLCGQRPDADQIAPAILAYLDEFLDGRGAHRPEEEPVAAHVEAGSGPVQYAIGLASREVERELLLQQPSLLLLHWHGRFGNRMHQYAYGVTYARINECRFWLPSHWEGTHLFETQHHAVLPKGRLRVSLNRSMDEIHQHDRRLAALSTVLPDAVLIRPSDPQQNYTRRDATVAFDDMCAYDQSIFTAMSRAHLRSVFTFSETVTRLDLYKRLADRQGTYDIAHLRRDDISNPRYNQTHVQGYSVISKRSYEAAFAKFGFDSGAIEWVSDDYTAKWHVDRPRKPRGRWRYPEGSEVLPDVLFDWLEDFLRLYFARTIFRANSSFSWWAAFLSPCARVFSPVIDKRHIYGVDGTEEIEVEFVEGNHPHWMFNSADIRIGP